MSCKLVRYHHYNTQNMTTDKVNREESNGPLPKFKFEVELGDELRAVRFEEISGLEMESQIIEYRHGNTPLFTTNKLPGLSKHVNLIMRKGMFVNDNAFWEWHAQIKMNKINERSIIIKLLDEAGNVSMQWNLNNAWPIKITGTDLKSEGNEVSVDTLEIAYDHITIS